VPEYWGFITVHGNDRLVTGDEERSIQEDERHRATSEDISPTLGERADHAEVLVWVWHKDKVLSFALRELVLIEKLDAVVGNDLNQASHAHTADTLHGDKRVDGGALLWCECSRMREGSEVQVMP